MSRSVHCRDPWIVRPRPNARAALRLFCFPYAGGGAAVYAPWAGALPETIEVIAVQPPGRAERLAEPAHAELGSLVEALFAPIGPLLDRPFAFFGHSMGALVSFELARALRRARCPQPQILIASGHGAPHLPARRPPAHHLPTPEFLGELRRLGGTPPEVLAHNELLELLLPTLRADFALCETYSYGYGAPLACPIVALGGLEDPDVSRADLEAWGDHTLAGAYVRMVPGGHFFLHSARQLVLTVVARELSGLSWPREREVG